MKNRNNKKQKMGNEFKNLQTKLFVRTVVIMLVAVVAVYALYTFVLHGNFANFAVEFINFFVKDYLQALHIYQAVFRNYMDLYILLAIAIVFLIVLKIYLRGFTKYFNEINKGIDTLIDENSGDVVLSSELVATEKKMNYIKHTIQLSIICMAAKLAVGVGFLENHITRELFVTDNRIDSSWSPFSAFFAYHSTIV